MTLFRQLLLGVSLLFLALLAGVEAIYLANSRVQLQDQLASQAQDTATSLALRLATLRSLEDAALVEVLVNPVFDRGYFREVRVVSPAGDVIVRKALPVAQGEVPDWFTRLFPIATAACSISRSGRSSIDRNSIAAETDTA